MINTTFNTPGRFGNQFFRNLAVHFIAKNNNLKISYNLNEKFNDLGIDLFSGSKTYDSEYIINDANFFDLIKNSTIINSNIKLEEMYAQTPSFTLYLHDYLNNKEQKDRIINANKHKSRYSTNNDVFIHVRLGDVPYTNPGLEYYDSVLSKLKFTNGYISSDTINHQICQQLILKYNLQIINSNEVDTIQFASTCKNIILSNGTFSWLIGALGYNSNIYYPKIIKPWHGDIFVIKSWNQIENIVDQESSCEYVGSRGIMKSCATHSSRPISSIRQLIDYDFSTLKPGSTIYVCGSAVPHFVQAIAPQIPYQYILVSGDCDQTVPNDLFASDNDFNKFVNSPNLIHWFSQNCVLTSLKEVKRDVASLSHPKLSQIPIGLDYHTMAERDHEWGSQTSPLNQEKLLKAVASKAKPLDQRICKAYANFQFLMTTKFGSDRVDAINQVPKDLVYYEPTKIKRLNTWVSQSKYAFVISPHGNGLDCHRTWEALGLGCIPIVKTSPLDPLFEDLPVLIVKSWSDVTQDLLNQTVQEYSSKQFNMEKLKLSYWVQIINSKSI